MKIIGEQKAKLWAAKGGWGLLLLLGIWLLFLIIVDWRIGIHFFALIFLGLLFWAVLGEPHTISVRKRYFNLPCKAKIALISDIHLGIYKKQGFLKRIIKKINTLHVDYVFIAGDLTYYPKIKKLKELFSPLSQSHAPVYLVLGNHDVEKPGHPVRKELIAAIQASGSHFLNNSIVHLAGFTLVGLGEYRAHEDDISLLETVQSTLPIIVLTHNPLTIKKYTERHHVDLTLCGHTHGWQIRLPFLEKGVGIFSSKLKHNSRGYLSHNAHNYFITGGVGEVGLPIRFFSPPTIDILYFGEKRRTFTKQVKVQLKKYRDKIKDILSRKKD